MTEERPARILVIDDEVTQRILVKEYLESAGYQVRLSDDGRRGLKMAAATRPDLIILDLMLPSMDGYTLCTCLKQAEGTADIPIILITAAREAGVIERGLAAGADDFVTKPVDWDFLADRVKFVLARSRQNAANAVADHVYENPDASFAEPASAAVIAAEAKAVAEAAAAREELERCKAAAREEVEAVERRCLKLLESARGDLKRQLEVVRSTAEAERDAAVAKHAEELDAVRVRAAREIEAVRNDARAEIERAQREAGEAVSQDAEDKHRRELEAARERADLEIEAMKSIYEARLASAATEREKGAALEQSLRNAEERHRAELSVLKASHQAALAEAEERSRSAIEAAIGDAEARHRAVPVSEAQLLAIEADCADRVRSCWEFTRAASVAQLDAVATLVEIARPKAGTPAEGSESAALAQIEEKARALAGSIGKLRLLAQLMSGSADFRDTTFDLAKLVSETLASVEGLAASERVAVTAELPNEPVFVRGDRMRLSYAVISVLVNAIRHTPTGGTAAVGLDGDASGAVRLVISDTGLGIAPAQLDALRTCLERPGQALFGQSGKPGFGIPITTALVRQHGGSIDIESGLGRGTVVTILLPAAAAATRSEFVKRFAT